MNELPEGWDSTALGNLVTLGKGKKPRILDEAPWPGAVPYIDIEGFEKGNIRRYADSVSSFLVDEGDVLIVWDGARCGYVGKAPAKGALGSTLGKLQPVQINPNYILIFLRSCYGIINSNPRGIGIPHVEPELFRNLEVPLAPLTEQKRIVTKVEELIARVNAAKERLTRVTKIMKRFRQAVLAVACSGRLTADWRETHLHFENPQELIERLYKERVAQYEELCQSAKQLGLRCPRKPSNLKPHIRQTEIELELPGSWFWTSLEDIASVRQYSMSSGPFGSMLGNKDYRPVGVPVIRGQNIQDGGFLFENFVYVSERKATELVRSIAHPGDIVVVAVGSSGQAAIVPMNFAKAVLSQNCNKITLDKSVALPEFVLMFLKIEIAKNQIRGKITDTARPFLSLTNLKKTLVAVPPVEEQEEIIHRVESMLKLADTVEKRIAAATVRAEKLTQSILAKAFRGELVPTEAELARREGRSYETASDLLARIKSERESKGELRKVPQT